VVGAGTSGRGASYWDAAGACAVRALSAAARGVVLRHGLGRTAHRRRRRIGEELGDEKRRGQQLYSLGKKAVCTRWSGTYMDWR
jgi:hypothetical protein